MMIHLAAHIVGRLSDLEAYSKQSKWLVPTPTTSKLPRLVTKPDQCHPSCLAGFSAEKQGQEEGA